MEESLALIIVGGVLSFMGVMMNAIPVKFDEDIFPSLLTSLLILLCLERDKGTSILPDCVLNFPSTIQTYSL